MKFGKKIICVLMAVLMLLPFAACSSESAYVAKYKNVEISSNMFSYMLSSQKAYLEEMFAQYYNTTDFTSVWAQEVDDDDGSKTTYANYIYKRVIDSAKMFAVVKQMCTEYGLTITDQSTADAIEAYVSGDIAAAGDENFLNIALAEYGANLKIERDYLTTTSLASVLLEYLYGENGSLKIPDSTITKLFNEKYNKIDAVYFSYYDYDSKTEKYTEKSDASITEADEKAYFDKNYANVKNIVFYYYDTKTEKKISDQEIKIKQTQAKELYDKIKSGELTYEKASEQNEDPGILKPEGECITTGDAITEIETAALDMEVGEIRLIESSVGMHILVKSATTEEQFTSAKSKINFSITKSIIDEKANAFYNGIKDGSTKFAANTETGAEYEKPIVYTDGEVSVTITDAAKKLAVNEVGKINMTDGVFFVRKLETNDEDLKSVHDTIANTAKQDAFYDYIESFYPQVIINQEEIDKYDFLTVKPLKIKAN